MERLQKKIMFFDNTFENGTFLSDYKSLYSYAAGLQIQPNERPFGRISYAAGLQIQPNERPFGRICNPTANEYKHL